MSEDNSPIRLDIWVAAQKGVSRTIAKDLIEHGSVSLKGKTLKSPGAKYPADSDINIDYAENIYVSRGGFKLEAALKQFSIQLLNKTCMDVGASTGGFTDCMLKNGAEKVYAIDTGTNQLADCLKEDWRVISMEKTDIRKIAIEQLDGIDFISVDVSFISIEKIIGSIYRMLKEGGQAVLLVKPQFEAGIGVVSKKGIIKNPKIHSKILKIVYNYTMDAGFSVINLCPSPIEGAEGNKEFLLHIKKTSPKENMDFLTYSKLADAISY